jgi:hypothetical protein
MTANPLCKAGWTIGDQVTINSKNRNSHGWRGVVDGFSEDVPGIIRVVVLFERFHSRILMTFQPTELVVST